MDSEFVAESKKNGENANSGVSRCTIDVDKYAFSEKSLVLSLKKPMKSYENLKPDTVRHSKKLLAHFGEEISRQFGDCRTVRNHLR